MTGSVASEEWLEDVMIESIDQNHINDVAPELRAATILAEASTNNDNSQPLCISAIHKALRTGPYRSAHLSHSGLLEPRGTSTVEKRPGILGMIA